jgi:hypothetical protein
MRGSASFDACPTDVGPRLEKSTPPTKARICLTPSIEWLRISASMVRTTRACFDEAVVSGGVHRERVCAAVRRDPSWTSALDSVHRCLRSRACGDGLAEVTRWE